MRHIRFVIVLSVLFHATAFDFACGEDSQPAAEKLAMRYGVRADVARYPQTKPQENLRSVVKAIEADDVTYLLAHLVWPAEVDKQFSGDRDRLVKLASRSMPEKSRKLADALARHLSAGKWTIGPHTARSQTDGLPDVTLSRLADRWFMHNVPSE